MSQKKGLIIYLLVIFCCCSPGYLVLLNHIFMLVKQLYDSLAHHHLHSMVASSSSQSQKEDCRTPGVGGTVVSETMDSLVDHTSTPNRYSSGSESLEQDTSTSCVLSWPIHSFYIYLWQISELKFVHTSSALINSHCVWKKNKKYIECKIVIVR